MENYTQNIELINSYINRSLSENETLELKKRLETDEVFNSLYNEHFIFIEGLKRINLNKSIKKAQVRYQQAKWLKIIGAIIITITVVLLLVFTSKPAKIQSENKSNTILTDTISKKTIIAKKQAETKDSLVVKGDNLIVTKDSVIIKNDIVKTLRLEPEIANAKAPTLKKESQIITINTQKDTLLFCKEGTRLKIKANSFVDKQNKTVYGNIAIDITEFYTLSDMLMANLSTTSNGKPLETGGMLYIEAKKDNSRLKLKDGSAIEVLFPTANKKGGMQLFSGKWQNGNINWNVETYTDIITLGSNESTSIPFNNIDIILDTVYRFERGKAEYIREIMHDKDFVVDSAFIKKWETYQKKRLIRVYGDLNDKTVTLRKSLFERKGSKFKILEDDSISRGGHIIRKVWSSNKIPTTSKVMSLKRRIENKEFEKRIESDSTLTSDKIGGYVLTTSQLGWINCDRFINAITKPVKYKLKIKNNRRASINMVFKSLNAILPSKKIVDGYDFGFVSKDEVVTLVAIKKEDGKLYLGMQETNTSASPILNLNYKEVSLKELKNKLKVLNKQYR